MIIEHFIAAIVVCSLATPPECTMYKDKEGPSDTRVECQVKMDALWTRITESDDVIRQVGSYSANQADHRGFCLNAVEDNLDTQIKRYYDL